MKKSFVERELEHIARWNVVTLLKRAGIISNDALRAAYAASVTKLHGVPGVWPF
jgi:hypothetical protein